MKAMTEQNNRMQIDSMQLTIPRARRRHFYNLRHSGYVTPLVSSSGKTKMAEENGGSRGGGVMNSSIAPIGIARRMILAIVTSREIFPGNFKWFQRAKLFRGFKW